MGPRLDVEIRRARDGDPRAFRSITEQLGPELTRFVTFFLHGDLHAANDVVQETFVQAWRNLGRFDSAEYLRPWLYRVAKCKAVSWLRRRSPPGTRIERLDSESEPPAGPPSGPPHEVSAELASRVPPSVFVRYGTRHDASDLTGALLRALEKLPRTYAAVVDLHYLRGFDTRETARLLDVPRTTVKMRLHRARKRLRSSIERTASPPRPGRARGRGSP